MKQFHSDTGDIWVEPTTGATVDTKTRPHSYRACSADDSVKIDTVNATLKFDQNTINALSENTSDGRSLATSSH